MKPSWEVVLAISTAWELSHLKIYSCNFLWRNSFLLQLKKLLVANHKSTLEELHILIAQWTTLLKFLLVKVLIPNFNPSPHTIYRRSPCTHGLVRVKGSERCHLDSSNRSQNAATLWGIIKCVFVISFWSNDKWLTHMKWN